MSEEIPVFSWNTKTKEFNVLGHKFDGVNSVEEFIEYLQNQDKEIERLHSIIKEVREYIENNSLYEEDYDYDYEENLVVGPPSDETARKILLEILDKEK